MSTLTVLWSIPSPGEGVWHLGPVPLRAYAFAIILGIVAAVWIGERRWVARGGRQGDITDLAIWAVPFGMVGGRLYHVVTDWQLYFPDNPWAALYVWRGGLGICGAIALGAIGIWIGARLRGIKLLPLLDAIAPGVLVAQAMGRWGNWFNQELYGRPTNLPWGLEIDPALLIPNPDKSLGQGALGIGGLLSTDASWRMKIIEAVMKVHGWDYQSPVRKLPAEALEYLLFAKKGHGKSTKYPIRTSVITSY